MSSRDRRAAGRQRAWGRGPVIIRFEPLEDRQLLASLEMLGSGLQSTATGSTVSTTAVDVSPAVSLGGGTSSASAAVTSIAAEVGQGVGAGVSQTTPAATSTASPAAAGTTSTSTSTAITTSPAAVPLNSTGTTVSGAPALVAAASSSSGTPVTPNLGTFTGTLGVAAPSGPADLVAGRIGAPSNLDWDETFQVTGSVRNQGGTATTEPLTVDLYASPATQLVQGSVKLGSVTVPAGLAPGQAYDFQQWVNSPQKAIINTARQTSYYVVMAVDTDNVIPESNEANNANQGLQGVDAAMVTYTPRVPPRLVAAGLQIAPTSLDWGSTMTVTTTVKNLATGNAPPTNARIILAPVGEDPFGPRGYTIGRVPMPAVLGNQTVSATQTIRLPANPPTALAGVGQFRAWMISDADQVADPVLRPTLVQGQGLDWVNLKLTPKAAAVPPTQLPDLKLAAIENPASIAWGEAVPVKAKVENNGTGNAGLFKVRFFLSQGTGSGSATMALGDVTVPSLQAQYVQDVAQTIKLPARPPAGFTDNGTPGVIVAQVDPDRSLDESSTTNNVLNSPPITLRVVGTDGSRTPVLTTTAPATPSATTTTTTVNVQPTLVNSGGGTSTGNGSSSTTPSRTPTPAASHARASRAAAQAAARAARVNALKTRTAVTPKAPLARPVIQQAARPNQPRLRVFPQMGGAPARAVRPLLQARGAQPTAGPAQPGPAQTT